MHDVSRHRFRQRGVRGIAVAQERQPEAAEALQFIRETMQQAGAFTAISGPGLIAAWTIYRKAQATRTPLFSGPARKVAMGLLPAMAAGAVLTAVFYRSN